MQGRFDEARADVIRARRLTEDFGQRVRRGSLPMTWASVDIHAGDLEGAETTLREGYEILTEIGEYGFRATLGSIWAATLVELGRAKEADALLDEVAATSAADDLDPQARWRVVKARIRAGRGEHEEARRLIDEAFAIVAPADYLLLEAEVCSAAAEVASAAGRREDAVEAAARALELLERKQDIVGAAKARARLEELRAAAEVPPGDTGTIVAT